MAVDLEEFYFEFECLKTKIQTIEIDLEMFNHFLKEKITKKELENLIPRFEQNTQFSNYRYDSSCMNIKMKLDFLQYINSFHSDFDALYNEKLSEYKKNNIQDSIVDYSNGLNQYNLVRILNYEKVKLSYLSEEKLYKGFADGFETSRFSLSIQSHRLIDGTVYYGFTPYYDENPFEENLNKVKPQELLYLIDTEGNNFNLKKRKLPNLSS